VLIACSKFPQMNFTQMHERLRLELLRRIQRGTLSVSLLARQTGFGQAHISNFLPQPAPTFAGGDGPHPGRPAPDGGRTPACVAQNGFWPEDESAGAVRWFHIPQRFSSRSSGLPRRSLCCIYRRALCILCAQGPQTCAAHGSALSPSAFRRRTRCPCSLWCCPRLLRSIDRHYNSLLPYRPNRPNLYAVRTARTLSPLCRISVKPLDPAAAEHRISRGAASSWIRKSRPAIC